MDNMNNIENYYQDIQSSVAEWLEAMAKDLEDGRFRFCKKGNLVPVSGHRGHMATCFAMRIAYATGIWDTWSKNRQKACIDFINSFQKEDGFFYDPWLIDGFRNQLNRILKFLKNPKAKDIRLGNIRAETRQTASIISIYNAELKYPLPYEIKNKEEAVDYVKRLNWNQPWTSCSHFGHQLALLGINNKYFKEGSVDNKIIIDTLLKELEAYHDKDTGTWFSGSPSSDKKINGAMKIFSGLQWLDIPHQDCTNLLDFALEQELQTDGCGFLNNLMVIYHARKFSQRENKDKIEARARQALDAVEKFRQSDGAFSFFQKSAQNKYYIQNTSRGGLQSDLHGTMMMTWAMAFIADILDVKCGWKIFMN